MAPWHQAIWGSDENQDWRDLESEHPWLKNSSPIRGHSQLPDGGDLTQSKGYWFGQNLSAPGKRSVEGSDDCEAQSNKSGERLIVALPEI